MKKILPFTLIFALFTCTQEAFSIDIAVRSVNLAPQPPGCCGLTALLMAEQLVRHGNFQVDRDFLGATEAWRQYASSKSWLDSSQDISLAHIVGPSGALKMSPRIFADLKTAPKFAFGGGLNSLAIAQALKTSQSELDPYFSKYFYSRWISFLLNPQTQNLVVLMLSDGHFWVANLHAVSRDQRTGIPGLIAIDVFTSTPTSGWPTPSELASSASLRTSWTQISSAIDSVSQLIAGNGGSYLAPVAASLRWAIATSHLQGKVTVVPAAADKIQIRNCMKARVSAALGSAAVKKVRFASCSLCRNQGYVVTIDGTPKICGTNCAAAQAQRAFSAPPAPRRVLPAKGGTVRRAAQSAHPAVPPRSAQAIPSPEPKLPLTRRNLSALAAAQRSSSRHGTGVLLG
jgi:hypothetical protein